MLLRAQVGADAAADPAEQLASSSAQGNAAAQQPEAEHLAAAAVAGDSDAKEGQVRAAAATDAGAIELALGAEEERQVRAGLVPPS